MKPFIIAVDFDGTIADHKFPLIGEPVPGAFEWLRRYQAAGAVLVLWTIRSDQPAGNFLTEAIDFCFNLDLEFDHVNQAPQDWTSSPKVYANVYIDDAAFGCPLLPEPGVNGRMMADWAVIGPAVMKMIDPDYLHDESPS